MKKKLESRNVIISIKPEFALRIIEGEKTIELRRRFPTNEVKGGIAIIYASSPIQKIIGYVVISEVEKLPVSQIWDIYSKEMCVKKRFFKEYFKGLTEGFAIKLSKPVKLTRPFDIKQLKATYKFSAPQSYRYAPAKILEALEE